MKLNYNLFLRASGMIAVFFYVLHIQIGGMLWKEYNHLQQPISDLTASGAPNRTLLLIFTSIYGVFALIFAFSFTLFESKKHHNIVFWGGVFFTILHIISISYGFFPEDMPNQEETFLGRMHIIVTALIVPFTISTPFLLGFGFIKETGWKKFGIFSIVTGVGILLFGGATAVFYLNKLPYFGLIERVNIGILQLWTFVFSYKLVTIKITKENLVLHD